MLRSPILLLVAVLAPAGALAAPSLPVPAASLSPPAEHPDRCLARTLRVPPDLAEHLPDRSDVWFRVTSSGKVVGLHAGDLATREITPYLREALGKCTWTPATDGARPVPSEVDLRLRFES